MNQEQLEAALAAKEEELRVAKEAEATAKASAASTVEELKELRQKKQEVEAERDLLKSKVSVEDVDDKIKSALAAKEAEEAERLKTDTLESFKEKHKDLFAEASDPGGLKFKAFEASLNKLNLAGLKTAKDFNRAFEDALILMNRKQQQERPENGNAAIPPTNGAPKSEEGTELEYKETQLLKSLGWTEERYLKLKKSRPAYVAALLRQSE